MNPIQLLLSSKQVGVFMNYLLFSSKKLAYINLCATGFRNVWPFMLLLLMNTLKWPVGY